MRSIRVLAIVLLLCRVTGFDGACLADEPKPETYWKVDDVRPGMKGTGQTVMVGTKLEEFGAEVLGVMKGVSPGRDMILCRLTGLNLEHAGIIQGMSGSPITIDGKLLGAVAFAWEFAKDPIAGVTPFEQMVEFVRAGDKRIAAGDRDRLAAVVWDPTRPIDEFDSSIGPVPVSGSMAGMKPIATPLAASGFSSRALAFLGTQFQPLGLAPMAGGAATPRIIAEEGDKPIKPGSPLSVAMVIGDFDLSGIGTVTHVEGDRVYGFGHPMMSLGACQFPMMSGYIHTVYPRASVSMKMGSPLKVVGVLDTDVSTGIAGRLGRKPDLLPMSVKVKIGEFSEPRTFRVEIVREPSMLPALVMSVLTNAIDTEGNLPDELTAKLAANVRVKGYPDIVFADTLSGARFTGPMGPGALFSSVGGIVGMIARNPLAPMRIESIDCELEITSGRSVAAIESIKLSSDKIEPGATVHAIATLKPFKGQREVVELELSIPSDFPEGSHDLVVCDMATSLRRKFRNEPQRLEPKSTDDLVELIRIQTRPSRTKLYVAVARPDRGVAVGSESLPNLPGSARALFTAAKQTSEPTLKADLTSEVASKYVIEGNQTLKFTVVKDSGLSLRD